MEIICARGQEVGDRKLGDQMGSGPNASQPSKSCLFNFRTDFRSDDRNLFSNSHLTKYIMHLKHIFFSFIGTKMRLISVVICGLFYSALANDEKQAKSIFFFFFCYCYSFTKVPVFYFF